MAAIKKDRYFEWLVTFVHGEDYQSILWRLYLRPFIWEDGLEMDRNRALDGIKLREENNGICPQFDEMDRCSVLEMLIAMAIRCEHEIMSVNGAGDRTIEWFWLMLSNLELDSIKLEEDLHDEVYQASAEDYISNVLDTFLNRDYNFDGSNGGLFKVEKPRADMRKTDLWMQLNWWLVEKYGYENE